ncbi:MAG: hypothetical protein GX562_06580 [Coriobacteriaceae bacterium]|nr:hypothetical protein [Coriobacteriaceae bacterium]
MSFEKNPIETTNKSTSRAPAHLRKERLGITKIMLVALIAIVVLAVAAFGIETLLSFNKIHPGVSVAGIDVGGLTKEQARTKLDEILGESVRGAIIKAKPDAEAQQRLDAVAVTDSDDPEDNAGDSEQGTDAEGPAPVSTVATSWDIGYQEVGATIADQAMIEKAYAVGRGSVMEYFSERFRAWNQGIEFEAELTFDAGKLLALERTIGTAIGISMVNYGIDIDDQGIATVTEGHDGECVDSAVFEQKITEFFIAGNESSLIVPLKEDPVDISRKQAEEAAAFLTEGLSQPVTISYQDSSWELTASQLGSWIKVIVIPEGTSLPITDITGSYHDEIVINPTLGEVDSLEFTFIIDEDIAVPAIQAVMGDLGYGSAEDAWFDVSSGSPVIQGGTAGEGPNIRESIPLLEKILFEGQERSITLTQGIVEPKITKEAAEAMGIKELIVSYTLNYGYGGSSNREFNIERALSFLNNSLVAPGQVWDFHKIVGNASYANGFKGAGAIVGNKVVTEEGGGICNVATGVFNAAYEAGLPIIERTNHSLYMSNYPAGRDSAVSWPSPNLIFENDMHSYILVTATWNGYDMVISIWGTSEGRTVGSSNSAWSYWDTGSSITNYRTVYDKSGNVLREDTFRSTFRKQETPKPETPETPAPEPEPEPEPNPTPETPEPDPGTTNPDPGSGDPEQTGNDT